MKLREVGPIAVNRLEQWEVGDDQFREGVVRTIKFSERGAVGGIQLREVVEITPKHLECRAIGDKISTALYNL